MVDDLELRLRLASDDRDDVVDAVVDLWPRIEDGVERMIAWLLGDLADESARQSVRYQVALALLGNGRPLSRAENVAKDALDLAFVEIDFHMRLLLARAEARGFAKP